MTFLTLPGNGRGVYEVFVEIPVEEAPPGRGRGAAPRALHVLRRSRQRRGHRPGLRHRGCELVAVPRPHVPVAGLWPVRRVRSGNRLVPARRRRHRARRAEGRRLRRVADGMDIVGWFGVMFIVVLLTGFYVWYWPGVRRWSTALAIKRGGVVHLQPVVAQGDRLRRLGPLPRRGLHRNRLRLPQPQLVVRERDSRPA